MDSLKSGRTPSPASMYRQDGRMTACRSPVGSGGDDRGGGGSAPGSQDGDNVALLVEDESGPVETDGDETDGRKRRAAIQHIQTKISRTKDLIKGEQNARDDNVNEYLKLASNADKQQIQRIKAVFEKKNQKSAQCIQQLQKKLDSYTKKLKDLETRGLDSSHHHQGPKEVLREMGHGLKHVGGNIRDGITGLSGSVMAKPREFAHLLKNRFGSADNINALSRNGTEESTEEEGKGHHGSATLPGACRLTSEVPLKLTSEEGSECSSVTSESVAGGGGQTTSPPSSTTNQAEAVLTELRARKHESDRLREKIEQVHKEIAFLSQALQEERFRSERLEEQVNDLTELHQNEVENLKTAISDMEEKVQYQSEERLRDIHEMLESCHTKISKMEHQQAQHQQYLTLEGLDNSNARALAVKLINVLLTVLQVVLLLVATAAGILMPFLRTRLRVLTTLGLLLGLAVLLKSWPGLLSLPTFAP